jgi:hypothetical protein
MEGFRSALQIPQETIKGEKWTTSNSIHFLGDVKLPEHVLVERVIDITADPSQRSNAALKFFGELSEDHPAGAIILQFEENLV